MDVLDAMAFSAAMRGEPAMVRFLQARRPGELAVGPPVVAEIEYGIRRLEPGSRKRLLLSERRSALLSAIRTLGWTHRASVEFGEIKSALGARPFTACG